MADEVLAVHAAEVDASGRFPTESIDALAAAGLTGPFAPGQLGGGGQGPRAFAAVVEELARGCASTAMIYVMHVARGAGDRRVDDARRAATRCCATSPPGKHLTTLAFSEKGSRSQFWAPVSRARVAQGRRLRHQRRTSRG